MTGKRGNKNFYKGIFFNLLLVNSKDILRMLLKSALFKLKVPISPKFLFSHLILCFMQ